MADRPREMVVAGLEADAERIRRMLRHLLDAEAEMLLYRVELARGDYLVHKARTEVASAKQALWEQLGDISNRLAGWVAKDG